MHQVLKKGVFTCTRNKNFTGVISNCKTTPRHGQNGTWISEAVQEAYTRLYEEGYARSYEAWNGDVLAGGLYGVKLGRVFFGESMFSHQDNASKAAFIWAVKQLVEEGTVIIDCQVYTPHLESLGAKFINRMQFKEILREFIPGSF